MSQIAQVIEAFLAVKPVPTTPVTQEHFVVLEAPEIGGNRQATTYSYEYYKRFYDLKWRTAYVQRVRDELELWRRYRQSQHVFKTRAYTTRPGYGQETPHFEEAVRQLDDYLVNWRVRLTMMAAASLWPSFDESPADGFSEEELAFFKEWFADASERFEQYNRAYSETMRKQEQEVHARYRHLGARLSRREIDVVQQFSEARELPALYFPVLVRYLSMSIDADLEPALRQVFEDHYHYVDVDFDESVHGSVLANTERTLTTHFDVSFPILGSELFEQEQAAAALVEENPFRSPTAAIVAGYEREMRQDLRPIVAPASSSTTSEFPGSPAY